MGQIGHFLTVT